MNYRMISHILSRVLMVEAALMALPLAVALIYGESVWPLVLTGALLLAVSLILLLFKPTSRPIYAKEGFVTVALSWILLSAFGALPFVFDGAIPNYIDAFFETVSGFTTTGASLVPHIEGMSYSLLFWRSFTHWIGGMGVLVFVLAIVPMSGERTIHIMRAEVPGPQLKKLVPKAKDTAMILYGIYVILTVMEIVLLIIGGMPVFDSIVHTFGTAGTGGFGIKSTSVAYYNSAYIDVVISVFMLLFGMNFSLFYLILLKKVKEVFKDSELRWYLGIVTVSVVVIAVNILPLYGDFFESLRYALFQTSSIITTTGFSTADFDKWPELSRSILVLLMMIGACAGSTGGAIKVSRIIIILKASLLEVRRLLHPRSVNAVKLNGKALDSATVNSTLIFFTLYMIIMLVSMLLVSVDGLDFTTTTTGVIACLGNIGPGLSLAGPMGSYAVFSPFAKIILSLDMLIGRLEIFPIIMLVSPSVWKRS